MSFQRIGNMRKNKILHKTKIEIDGFQQKMKDQNLKLENSSTMPQ